ncbi:MAG: hypothetical protein ACUZ8H_05425 [Candidatus Anammoxibacter sp.]
MSGYIKTTINFSKIEKSLEAAKALDSAGETEQAIDMLVKIAETISKEVEQG